MAASAQSVRPSSWPWVRQHQDYGHSTPFPAPSQPVDYSQNHEIKESAVWRQLTVDEEAARDPQLSLNRELWTRDLCIVGLILGWGASLASIATGIYIIATPRVPIPPWLVNKVALVGPMAFTWYTPDDLFLVDERVYSVSEVAMIIIPLLLQAAITFVSVCLDSIHSTTLRWALWREGRLRHNTNLRLFTYAKGGPNAWPANIVSSLSLLLAFGGASVMTFPVVAIAALEFKEDPSEDPMNFNADLGPDRFGLSFNAWGLVGLGAGLLLQCIICSWCLVQDATEHVVGTWNSNPLATARACRCLLSGVSGPPPTASDSVQSSNFTGVDIFTEPAVRQPSMCSLVPATRTITNCIWAIFALHCVFTIVVSIVAAVVQHSASLDFVRDRPAPVDFENVWKVFGLVEVKYNPNPYSFRLEWAGMLIQCAAVSTLLFGLHMAEVLGGLARDEAIWQRATTRRGTSPEANMLLEGVRNWPHCVIFVYKAIVPWIFSYGFACNTRIFLAIFPLLTIAILFLILGLFSEYLIRIKPKGSQPATYGDLQALVALVDDWSHDTIFWGDKGGCKHVEGVRIAGTAGSRLADLIPGVKYKGLSTESRIESGSNATTNSHIMRC